MKQGFPFKLYRKCVSVCFVGISDHSTHITTPLDLRPICRIGQLEVLDGDEDIGRGFRPDAVFYTDSRICPVSADWAGFS